MPFSRSVDPAVLADDVRPHRGRRCETQFRDIIMPAVRGKCARLHETRGTDQHAQTAHHHGRVTRVCLVGRAYVIVMLGRIVFLHFPVGEFSSRVCYIMLICREGERDVFVKSPVSRINGTDNIVAAHCVLVSRYHLGDITAPARARGHITPFWPSEA